VNKRDKRNNIFEKSVNINDLYRRSITEAKVIENVSGQNIEFTIVIDEELSGVRLDQALAKRITDFSRSRLQTWVKAGNVLVDGEVRRSKDKVYYGESIHLKAVLEDQVECQPEDIPLDILHEDEHILVINKPAGLVVHPAVGNWSGTLQNGLLHHQANLIELPRAGIVHRLDKDTSGVMVVAKSLVAHKYLVEALQAREVKREYRALVIGLPTTGSTVDEPIGRHPTQRTRMAVVRSGKEAVTHFRINERFRIHTFLQVNLETGRTHQIRVHLSHINLPIVGDSVYGGRLKLPQGATEELKTELRSFKRQALHAYRLSFDHPVTKEPMEFEAPIADDILDLLAQLREDSANND